MKFFTNPRNLGTLSKLGKFGLQYLGISAAGSTFVGVGLGGVVAAFGDSDENILKAAKFGAKIGGLPVTGPYFVARALIATSENSTRGPR